MASCIVPHCRCVRYQSAEEANGCPIAYRPDCGCAHPRSLHRTPTPVDTLVIDELALAASVPCSSLIPVPELPSMTHFSQHDLIPVPPDEIDSEVSNVLCLCEGFSSTHISVLHKFSDSSINDVHSLLPHVKCARCTHPLLTHQRAHPSHYLCNQKSLRLKSTVSIEGVSLPHPKLITLDLTDDILTIAAIVWRNSSYQFLCGEVFLEKKPVTLRRRSSRLSNPVDTSGSEEKQSIDKVTSFLRDLLAMPTDLLQEIQDPVCLTSTRFKESPDHASRLMVAVATSGGKVVVFDPCSLPGTHLVTTTTTSSPPVALKFSCLKPLLLAVLLKSGIILIWDCLEKLLLTQSTQTESLECNDLIWSEDNRYLFVTTDIGQIAVFQLTIDKFVQCQLVQCCTSSCTALYWDKERRFLFVGSADTKIHLLKMTPPHHSLPEGNNSIKSYFTPLRRKNSGEKLRYCGVMKGHQSFVSSILLHCNSIASIGWDNHLIIWSSDDINRATMSGNDDDAIDIEPDALYKLGPQDHVTLLPCGMYSVNDMVLISYQGFNRLLSFGLY